MALKLYEIEFTGINNKQRVVAVAAEDAGAAVREMNDSYTERELSGMANGYSVREVHSTDVLRYSPARKYGDSVDRPHVDLTAAQWAVVLDLKRCFAVEREAAHD